MLHTLVVLTSDELHTSVGLKVLLLQLILFDPPSQHVLLFPSVWRGVPPGQLLRWGPRRSLASHRSGWNRTWCDGTFCIVITFWQFPSQHISEPTTNWLSVHDDALTLLGLIKRPSFWTIKRQACGTASKKSPLLDIWCGITILDAWVKMHGGARGRVTNCCMCCPFEDLRWFH